MSSTSKRPPEEGNLSSLSSARHPHEDASCHPNTTPETAQDSRAGKAPRIESRDADRQSPLQSVYRMPLSGSDSHKIHAVAGPENRLETRESKESRENKLDSRDAKAEPRELYHQIAKIDKDENFQSRGDDTKEMKYDRETHGEPKTDIKTGNEIYGSSGGHSNWKVHNKGKIHMDGFENPEKLAWGGIAFADLIRLNHGLSFTEDMGEMKLEYKEKERKRKEVKHHDWVDRDKADNRGSLPVNSSGNNHKEPIREEHEGGRWEKDKKDVPIDKDRPKDKEKSYPIKEMWNAAEKEVLQIEKETVDRLSEKDNVALVQKRPREADVWRNADKEARDRGKEPEVDVEGERPEKRIRCTEKDLKEGGDDAGIGAEREKEGFNCTVQQRKRMLRPRGSPQAGNREPRFKPRGSEEDGSDGKPELLTIVYKVGECMQDLFKVWKEYESSQADKNAESSLGGPTLEIKIPGEHVTATNRQVRGGQLWGTDVYTNDSDLVAVLMHMGYCRTSPNPPPPALQEVRVIIRVLPPQDFYVSSLRNNVRSRAWGAGIGCSYRVERCFLVKKGCEPREIERSLTHSSTIEPTLAPVAVERTMTTRAAASNALRQQRFVREVTLQYNLCNEPWIKYTINVVADKGLKKPMFTSARLKKGEVLYMETHFHRFELCFLAEKVMKTGSTSQSHETETDNKSQNQNSHAVNGERSNADGEVVDVFRFSRCKKNLPQGVMKQYGIPLPVDLLEVVEDNLDWEDVLWSQTGVWIGGKEYQLARVHFMSPN